MLESLKRPKKLLPGDTVATVSSSWGGPGLFPHRYEVGKQQLESTFGIKVIEMPNTLRDPAWLKDNPQARADDLMQAFSNKDIKGIISTIGGDDSIRILPFLDVRVMAENPKIFLGYSDTTVTHFACLKAGVRSFYGPSIMAGFAENGGLFPFTQNAVYKALFSTEAPGSIEPVHEWTDERIDWSDIDSQNKKRKMLPVLGRKVLQGQGIAEGRLIGGCAEVLEMIKGTDFWPSKDIFKGAILFLETSEEAPPLHYFTRWIRNLGVQGILQNLSGIILARPAGQETPEDLTKYDTAVKSVVGQEFGLTALPIMTQMDFGHTDPMFVLPLGSLARMDCDNEGFSIIENSVLD